MKTQINDTIMKLGKIKRITDIRSVWHHEEKDFSKWLAQDENLKQLSDTIGIDIVLEERESSVGNFSVDLYALEEGTERRIIIENQLEDTNHDHLGKLITYASGKSADIIIWVVKKAREEHRSAIEWLNNHTDEKINFFLVEIKLYQIGDSEIAVKFEVVEKPNDWTKEIKKQSSSSPSLQARFEYWTAFNDYAFQNKDFVKYFNKRKVGTNHYITFSMESSVCHMGIVQVRKDSSTVVELYISDDKDLFKLLYSNKIEIEKELGFDLDWRELPDKKASRILARRKANFENKDEWIAQFDWIIDVAIKMKKAFKKYL